MSDRVLVLGDDIGIFLAVARSLGRRGVEVDVAPSDLGAPGLASRYVRAVRTLPPYHAGAAAWTAALRELIAAHGYRLVVPCSDAGLLILDHHCESLGRERLALPNPEAVRAFTDKAETRALARRLGIGIADGGPITAGTTAADLAGRLGLPLVLKPRRSYRVGDFQTKRPARIAADLLTLEQALASEPGDRRIAESFFPGVGVGVSVLAREGRILLAWQHRRLRAVSDTGASSVRTGEPTDPQLLAEVEALARATALTGVAMFEFRCDRKTGAHVLLEVNPRFWGSLPLALAAGADFPALLHDLLTGSEPGAGPVRRSGLVKRSMTGEVDRLAGRIAAAGSAAGKLLPAAAMLWLAVTTILPRRFDSWSADDPEPFRAERRHFIQRLLAGLAKLLPSPGAGAAKRFEL